MKNFPLPPNERERLEELRRYALLDTPPEKAFDNITTLAARIFQTPIAAVTLIDQDRQWFKSCVGLETREVGRNFAFCAHAILGTGVMVVPDARLDPRFADSPLVTGPPHICFYAAMPLRTRNGLNLGTLTVSDIKPREMTEESTATLTSLAALVVSEIELRYEIGQHHRTKEGFRLLQKAIEQSSESVIITTADVDLPGPEIVSVNPAFTRLTGYSAEEVIGKTPRLLQGPKTDRATLDDVRARLRRGDDFEFEVVNYRKDGSDFVMRSHISPIRETPGEISHYICFQYDTTERDRAAALLRQAKEEAERANQAKSEFLSRMSHELRTPLHAILGYSQLLEMDGLSVGDQECVSHIIGAGNHLLGLVNEVLDLARVESGELTLTLEPVSVREALEGALVLVKPQATERGVRLEPPAGDLDGEILVSAQRFRQVMVNLLSNAVKFNRSGGTVGVSVEIIHDRLRISVADTGRGLSAENIARLYVPFERLDVSDTGVEGAGLGLSLSKHLVEAMGGAIGVESVVDLGSTFWVELPLVRGEKSAPGLTVVPPGREEPLRPAAELTLLYIEDNQSNLRLVQRILARRPQVKLFSAMLGSLGLQLVHEQPPDLVLLDLHLPDIPGDEILRQLRADPRTADLPVVMISADATAAQIARLRALGATDYLTKPIDVRQFLAVVDSIKPLPRRGERS